jgi:hypothetical protein
MKRSLDHEQMIISCTRGHPPVAMATAGYYALKEAGAKRTIIAFSCTMCHRTLYVMAECPYAIDQETINTMDVTP